MVFRDRQDAGRKLAVPLSRYSSRPDVTVLGVPRGGVPVAAEIASALHVPIDIFLSRKLGVPGYEELAFGAIASEDGRYLDQKIIQTAGVTPQQIEQVTAEVKATLARRAALYRGSRPPLVVSGRTIILVDDGIATGASMYAAILALRQMNPARLIVAVPVAPPAACEWLRSEVDELVCLYEPDDFYAVGQFYRDFSQVTDQQVMDIIRVPRANVTEDIHIRAALTGAANAKQVDLQGKLDVPDSAKGLIIFAHGSGSSRQSPRNRYVAEVLQKRGFATLLFDLLTAEEEINDRRTAELRFNISLLAQRLVEAVHWSRQQASVRHLSIGLFGASTGAAAALVAAAQLSDEVTCVVSRGGRPDLAETYLERVEAAVLLIVGGKDETVVEFNRQAMGKLRCLHKDLMIVPGATHLFEEAGALDVVSRAAADWFARYAAEGVQ